jgi:hypothetical protein
MVFWKGKIRLALEVFKQKDVNARCKGSYRNKSGKAKFYNTVMMEKSTQVRKTDVCHLRTQVPELFCPVGYGFLGGFSDGSDRASVLEELSISSSPVRETVAVASTSSPLAPRLNVWPLIL